MKCNRIVNPLGFELDEPVLSWIVETEEAKLQKACRIVVAEDEGFSSIVFDSKEREELSGIGVPLPIELKPRTRYFWKVHVWTDAGEAKSDTAWFETAKLDEAWEAKWITPDTEDTSVHPIIRKNFNISKEVASARLYISGLGLYEAEVNGSRVSDEYFAPYCNDYNDWIQYQTFDVTKLLTQGENCLAALLGNGWYKGRFGFTGRQEGYYGDRFLLISELVIQYTDSTTEKICSDESFLSTSSHITKSNIYDGEAQDANKYIKGWSEASLPKADLQKVKVWDKDTGLLEARRSLPVIIKEKRKPVKVIHTPKGETVLDMGQNMVGFIHFKVQAPKGTRIWLQYGEEMQEGCFYRENLRTAKAEFEYVSDGEASEVRPYFTFYGFRYVKVEGLGEEINPEDFTGCVIYSDLERTGNIETSNPMINRLFLNALWGQKGNFLDVPTDCPQRDERMGWTGDAQMFSGTACFNMDCDAFFRKFLYDLAKEQANYNGVVPHTVPSFGFINTQDGEDFAAGNSSAWADVATIIPWNLYLYYGDKSALRKQFDSMKAYVDSIRRKDDGSRLWNSGFHFGDWVALDGKSEYDTFGGTPRDIIATAYYAYSSELVGKAAGVLGMKDMEEEYLQLSKEIKAAFTEEFVSPRGRLVADTQTSYILPLFMNLIPNELRGRVLEDLCRNLKENNYFLKTGFVGTPYLCRVLSENGHNDIAYKLLLNEEYPSWIYEIKLGATTIWERWNSLLPDGKFGELGMNSLNHYAYGSIVEWMYRNMCGINPTEEYPGFQKIKLKPYPDKRISQVKASLKTAAGSYESGWSYKEDGLHYNILIPFNAQAEFLLDETEEDKIIVNGIALKDSDLSYDKKESGLSIILTAGRYQIILLDAK